MDTTKCKQNNIIAFSKPISRSNIYSETNYAKKTAEIGNIDVESNFGSSQHFSESPVLGIGVKVVSSDCDKLLDEFETFMKSDIFESSLEIDSTPETKSLTPEEIENCNNKYGNFFKDWKLL